MKAEKEPEEFEFGCEDLTKDWFDEISDMEEPEEKIRIACQCYFECQNYQQNLGKVNYKKYKTL